MSNLDNRSSRDTRLLALIIVVALAVLLVLARYRFPVVDGRPTAVTPGPLDRLAARAAFDDLAATVNTVLQRAAVSIAVIDLERSAEAGVAGGADTAVAGEAIPSQASRRTRRAGAIRLGDDLGVVYLPDGYYVAAPQRDGTMIDVRFVDRAKSVAVLRLPPDSAGTEPIVIDTYAGLAYAAAVEAGLGGPTAQPLFVGRVDPVDDALWGSGVLAVGGSDGPAPGSLLFTLDGHFIGLAVRSSAVSAALVPFAMLRAVAMSAGGGEGGLMP
jgi:hypothetical protein